MQSGVVGRRISQGGWSASLAAAVRVVVVVVIVLVGCSGGSEHVSEVVAQSSTLPEGIDATQGPVGALVDEESGLASTWSRFGFPEPTIAFPDDGVLLFIGTVESGSCPVVVERVAPPRDDIDADAVVTIGTRGGGSDCTDDANPVSFVLSLRDAPIGRVYVEHGERGSAASGYVDLEPRVNYGAADVVGGVSLAEPGAGFAQQCQDAATSLGIAVPCPTRLPLIAGQAVRCSGSCVGIAGGDETEARAFVLNVEGYDGIAGSPETVRHLVIEARKAQEAPPSPCYEGVPAGTLMANGQEVALLGCPQSSPEAEANMRHGEGIHAEHLLGYWDDHEVRYAVSVHGATDANRALLEQLVSSIELVEP